MKHILLNFAETPSQENIDMSIVEYSEELNLNVLRDTNIPAVTYSNLTTETFTKAHGEVADSDRDQNSNLEFLLITQTDTYKHAETSDADNSFKDGEYLAVTNTLTESSEDIDSDK